MSDVIEEILLEYIRVAGIFFVGGIALFNFTNLGKEFSIISLLIALVLIISSLVEFYYQKHENGIHTKTVTDVLAYVMVVIALLIVWVIYTVWHSEQTTLQSIAKEIEREVDITNAQLMKNIQQLDEKVSRKLTEPIISRKYSLKGAKSIDDLAKLSSLASVS